MNRKYKQYSGFFQKIDTKEKAYVLGLFFADGNNFVHEERSKCSLVLHSKDRKLLERIQEIIDSDRPLQESYNTTVLHIAGRECSNHLSDLGCVPRKSLILKFPSVEHVPKELVPHFIRGYFDGDGCVSYRGSNLRAEMIGTEDFINGVLNVLQDNNITCSIYSIKGSTLKAIKIFRKVSVRLFYDLIYTNSTIKMERKYETFVNHLKL